LLPAMLWAVEVSLPQLFPAHATKLGDIVMNATCSKNEKTNVDYNLFLFARLPSQYLVFQRITNKGPSFISLPSLLISHVELIHQ